MNILTVLLGGAVATKKLTDYPAEIREFRDKLPKSERDAVLHQYKKLPRQAKADFKAALRNADMTAAGKILGEDLTKYNVALNKPAGEIKTVDARTADVKLDNQEVPPEENIIARVNKILAVPTGIDPELVAEAARRYEECVPSGSNLAITDKTKRIVDLSS